MITSLIKNNIYLLVSIFLTIIIFILFLPPFYTSNDERNFIQNAYYISQGGIDNLVRQDVVCEGNGNEAYGFKIPESAFIDKEGCISKYNLGSSILLSPFVSINWHLAIVITFVFFLISIIFFYKSLVYLKIPKIFILLYSFFPPFAYYSHKSMSEIFSLAFVSFLMFVTLKIQYNYKKETNPNVDWLYMIFGFISGLLVLVRYTNAVIVLSLLVYIVLINHNLNKQTDFFIKSSKSLLKIFLGALPFIILFIFVNAYLYGGIFKSGYSLSGEEFYWNLKTFFKQIPQFLLMLNIMYPVMLVGICISVFTKKTHSLKFVALFLIIFFVLFYGGFYGFNFNQGINNFLFGMRFFLPILPLILLVYFDFINRIITRLKFSRNLLVFFIIVTTIILFAGKVVISKQLFERVSMLKSQSDQLYLNNSEKDRPELPYILINDAFGKGQRYVKEDVWVPLDLRAGE